MPDLIEDLRRAYNPETIKEKDNIAFTVDRSLDRKFHMKNVLFFVFLPIAIEFYCLTN